MSSPRFSASTPILRYCDRDFSKSSINAVNFIHMCESVSCVMLMTLGVHYRRTILSCLKIPYLLRHMSLWIFARDPVSAVDPYKRTHA